MTVNRFAMGFMLILGMASFVASTPARAEIHPLPKPELDDNGLHIQPWFKDSFLDLRDDLREAVEKGKRLVIFWEQKGCPYCKKMHEVNLTNRQIVDYIKKNFDAIQLNTRGERMVTGFDGRTMSERKFASASLIIGTPTIQFFTDDPAKAEGKTGRGADAWRFVGYYPRAPFLNAFVYVAEKGYEKEGDFFKWLRDSGETVDLKIKD